MPDISTVYIKLSNLSAESYLSSYKLIDKNDIFTIARQGGEDVWSNFNVPYYVISALTIENLRTISTLEWNNGSITFDNKQSLDISTAAIERNYTSENRIGINIDFFRKNILQKIYDLSTYIYSRTDPHVPSFVGQIITTRTKDTEDKIKKTYSNGRGSWVQIGGRFLIGTGRNTENDASERYGVMHGGEINLGVGVEKGSDRVTLTAAQIPVHSHKFRSTACKFNCTWYMSWINECLPNNENHACGVQFFPATQTKRIRQRAGNDNGLWQVKKGSMEEMSATFTGEGHLSTTDWHNLSIESAVYTTSGSKITATQSHNNIPPFIVEFIWKRVS